MVESGQLAKAMLLQLDADFKDPINPENWTTVQFNPETLKVSFTNQIVTPAGAGDQSGPPARQFVGEGTMKLALQLWFDVSAQLPPTDGEVQVDDVRKLTQKVAFFITPEEVRKGVFVPPAVCFLWGSFRFDGIMESLEESLEFFSSEGKPLRASMSLNISQQRITKFRFPDEEETAAGTRVLIEAPAGSTLQGLASSQGKGANWQGIAEANGIENPRLLQPGQLIDMNATVPRPLP